MSVCLTTHWKMKLSRISSKSYQRWSHCRGSSKTCTHTVYALLRMEAFVCEHDKHFCSCIQFILCNCVGFIWSLLGMLIDKQVEELYTKIVKICVLYEYLKLYWNVLLVIMMGKINMMALSISPDVQIPFLKIQTYRDDR